MTPRGYGWNAYMWERQKTWGVHRTQAMKMWDDLSGAQQRAWTTIGVAEASHQERRR